MPRRFHTVAPKQGNLITINEDEILHSSVHAQRIPRENDFGDYAIHTLRLKNVYVQQFDIQYPLTKRQSTWKKKCEMPCWLLLLLVNFFVILLAVTFCVVFIYKESKVSIGQACLQNSDCNSYTDLICTTGKCSCSSVYFWDGFRCIPQRTFNRSCTSQTQCDSLAKLLCMNVTIGSSTNLFCWCSNYRYWTGDQCANLKTFNITCSSNYECDFHSYLTCSSGFCDCNSSQFWNNVYCENKRLYGDQCFTNYWCNNVTADLACSTWSPTAGTCDCLSNQYWSSGNTTCLPQLPLNATCSFTYQCLTNQSLYCSSSITPNSCQCLARYWYNTTKCTPKLLQGSSCTNSLQCDDTVLLTCNLTSHICLCNESNYIWDGIECVVRRSIGGSCSSNSDCLANQNLVCDTTGIWNDTCACPINYYWNTSISLCVLKKLWHQTCSTSYECYDGGYLSCQTNVALNTTVCDCQDYTYYWTGFLNNTYSDYCTPKINYNISFTCVSSYQCRDYNNITCVSGQCTCSVYQYWNGTMCEPRLNYSSACNSTAMCQNWPSGPNLQCLVPLSGSIQQCLCTSTQYFDYCVQYCYTVKDWQQTCNISSCYPVSMCDQTKSLSCISNICNCSNTQWWNTTTCVSKGTYLDSCDTGENYQCEEYNLLSCIASQCQCTSTLYWSSSANNCTSKQTYGGACASNAECLTVAIAGLTCVSSQCDCPSGYTWNSATQQCDVVG